jgi:hypothetical protein
MVTGFDSVSINLWDWRALLEKSSLRTLVAGIEFARSPEEMRKALQNPDIGMIVNPYGDTFPGGEPGQLKADLDLLKQYVRRGGVWWETGSSSFDKVLVKQYFRTFDGETMFPSSNDFACVSYQGGNIAMYGIQSLMRKPWDRERLAVPASYQLFRRQERRGVYPLLGAAGL